MLCDREFCVDVWSALTNTVWKRGGESYSYSFRAAGDLIASILDEGDYMDWYCCGSQGNVSGEIAREMAKAGWVYEKMEIA